MDFTILCITGVLSLLENSLKTYNTSDESTDDDSTDNDSTGDGEETVSGSSTTIMLLLYTCSFQYCSLT